MMENSVVQLQSHRTLFNPKRPYQSPEFNVTSGSGFIVDGPEGLVVTNAHIGKEAYDIVGRLPAFGRENLRLKLISMCGEKDIAICQFTPESLKRLQDKFDLDALTLPLGDSMDLRQGEAVTAIGYPLGEEGIKFTSGILSGFARAEYENVFHLSKDAQIEDALRRAPTFLQFSAPVNPGNSGGPLINSKGEVIGIVSAGETEFQGIGYAVSSRVLSGFFSAMLDNSECPCPTWNLEWSPTQYSEPEGLRVRKIYPDSCLQGLKSGDILTGIQFFRATGLGEVSCDFQTPDKCRISGKFGRFGDVDLNLGRILHLSECVDLLPVGSPFRLQFLRNGKEQTKEFEHSRVPSSRVPYVPFQSQNPYLIFGGMCLVNLTLNLAENFESLFSRIRFGDGLFECGVVIASMFPGTPIFDERILFPGDMITSVNGTRIRNLDEFEAALGDMNRLETREGAVTSFSITDAQKWDDQLSEEFNL